MDSLGNRERLSCERACYLNIAQRSQHAKQAFARVLSFEVIGAQSFGTQLKCMFEARAPLRSSCV